MQKDLRKKILGVLLSASLLVFLQPQYPFTDPGVQAADTKTDTANGSATVNVPSTMESVTVSYKTTSYCDSVTEAVFEKENESRGGTKDSSSSGSETKAADNSLMYDNYLQSYADERAKEIALYYQAGKRPNGTLSSPYVEKVTTGTDATAVAKTLVEGAGSYNYTAIGHSQCGGVDYWIQVFEPSGANGAVPTRPSDTSTFTTSIQRSFLKSNNSITVTYTPGKYSIQAGSSLSLPEVGLTIATSEMAADAKDSLTLIPVSTGWTSAITTIATVSTSEGKVNAVNKGSTELSGTVVIGAGFSTIIKVPVTVTQMTLSADNTNITLNATYPMSGGKSEPHPTVRLSNGTTLRENTDYTLEWSENTKEGTGKVTVKGCGNYTGSVTGTFTVTGEVGGTLSGAKVELAKNETVTYDGTEKKPDVKVTLSGVEIDKTNYNVSYTNNINAGTATITVTGTGSLYSGTATGKFTIQPVSLTTANVDFTEKSFPYTGDEIKPTVTVKVGSTTVDASNYTVSYSNNVNITSGSSKASVTVKGINNCKDEKKKEFEITKGSLDGATVKAVNTDNTTFQPVYSGLEQRPPKINVFCKGSTKALISDTDFTVTYSEDLKNAGTVTMTITGKGSFEGTSATGTYEILPKSVNVLTISGNPGTKDFTGKEIKPAITVYDGSSKLKKTKDYTVTYSNNTAPGKAKIKVEMTGNYSGSKTLKFTITLGAPTIKSLTSRKGSFTVKWKKVKGDISGYQIKYRNKAVKVEKSKSGLTVKGLKSGLVVGAKIRAYYTSGGKTYYGAFSSKKTVTVK